MTLEMIERKIGLMGMGWRRRHLLGMMRGKLIRIVECMTFQYGIYASVYRIHSCNRTVSMHSWLDYLSIGNNDVHFPVCVGHGNPAIFHNLFL